MQLSKYWGITLYLYMLNNHAMNELFGKSIGISQNCEILTEFDCLLPE